MKRYTGKHSLSFTVDLTNQVGMIQQSPRPARTSPDAHRANAKKTIPPSPDEPNLDSFSLADEVSRAADSLKWSRLPEMREFEKIAEVSASTHRTTCSTQPQRKGNTSITCFSYLGGWERFWRRGQDRRANSRHGAAPKKWAPSPN